MRNFRQSEYLDRLESDDEYDDVVELRPCVKPLELTEEALEKERQRSLSVLAAVLGKNIATATTDVETGTINSSSSKNATKEQKEKEKQKEKKKEKAKEDSLPSEEEKGKYTGTAASGFAQLGALKDIFHKEVRSAA